MKNYENCQRIMDYFEVDDAEDEIIKGLCFAKFPTKTSMKGKIQTMKSHMKNLSEVKDEVRIKFDITEKLRKMKNKISDIRDHFYLHIDDNIKVEKENKNAKEKPFRLSLNNKSGDGLYMYNKFYKRTTCENFFSPPLLPVARSPGQTRTKFYSHKPSLELGIGMSTNTATEHNRYSRSKMKVNELASLVSKGKQFDANNTLFKNFSFLISSPKISQDGNFSELSETLKNYLKPDVDKINSENKQIQLFLIILDKLVNSLSKKGLDNGSIVNSKSRKIERNAKIHKICAIISIIDSLFTDFCLHLSISSNHRAEFLQKIIILRDNYRDEKDNINNKIIYELENEVSSHKEEIRKLTEIIEKVNKEKSSISINMRTNKKELDNLKQVNKEKEEEIEELKKVVSDKDLEIGELNSVVAELNKLKMNRKRGVLMANPNPVSEIIYEKEGEEDPLKERIGIQRKESKSTTQIVRIENNPLSEDKRELEGIKEEEVGVYSNRSPNYTSKNASTTDLTNLDLKDIIKTRTKRTTFSNTRSKKLTEKQEMLNQRKQTMLQNSVLSMDTGTIHQLINQKAGDIAQHNLHFQKYMDKGFSIKETATKSIEVQTDVSSLNLDQMLISKLKLLEINSESVKTHLKVLNNSFLNIATIISGVKYKSELAESSGNPSLERAHTQEISGLHEVIAKSNSDLLDNMKQLINECDIVIKDNENLREKVEKLSESHDALRETYTEIFEFLVKNISESNEDLHNFLNSTQNRKVEEDELFDFLNKLIEKNAAAVEKDKGVIFSVIPQISIKSALDKHNFFPKSGPISDFSHLNSSDSSKIYTRKSISKDLINEFLSTQDKIKLNINWKKTVKVIDSIYFDWFDKIYFKKDRLNFDMDDNFIIFSDIPLYYFNQHFGLESLAKKKFFEFLKGLSAHAEYNKRIGLFYKMIQLNKSDPKQFFDVFVTRQLILLIQHLKIHSCLYINKSNQHSLEEESDKSKFGIYYSKSPEIVFNLIQKLPHHMEIKTNIQDYIDKNKHIVSHNLRNFHIFDFDDFLEFYSENIKNIKDYYIQFLTTIFNSIDMEKKSFFTFYDLLISKQYLMNKFMFFGNVRTLFERFCDNSSQIKLEQFESLVIENDLFDARVFMEYLKIQRNDMLSILLSLKEKLKDSSLSVFDSIRKRFAVLKDELKIIFLLNKLQILRDRITNFNESKDDAVELWLCLRLLDDISLDVYNEFRIYTVYKSLSDPHRILEDFVDQDKKENMVLAFVKING